jgi:triacylglycerol esterase/lipase EstA (alpha/beta hydrolase family)
MFHSPGTGFDLPGALATSILVDYGQYINLPTLPPHSTKQAVVLGAPVLPPAWQWGGAAPVHMICHSQGGNTVRLLIEFLSGNHGPQNPAYFGAPGNRQNFVRSVVTLGTPYLGTSITGVIFNVSLLIPIYYYCALLI